MTLAKKETGRMRWDRKTSNLFKHALNFLNVIHDLFCVLITRTWQAKPKSWDSVKYIENGNAARTIFFIKKD